MVMSISKSVGKNAHGQTSGDVKLVQTALSAIKCKKGKPYYKGRIDGKSGAKTVESIENFQCDNKIKVTGKVESVGPTINNIKQKTPAQMKTVLGQSGGGGHGAVGSLNNKKIEHNNNKVIAVLKKWPLPTAELQGLIKWVDLCTKAMVPLDIDKNEMLISNQGNFVALFTLAPWATGEGQYDTNAAKIMVKNAADLITGISKWQRGEQDALYFKSTAPHSFLQNLPAVPQRIRSKLKLRKGISKVQEKLVAAAIKQSQKMQKNQRGNF